MKKILTLLRHSQKKFIINFLISKLFQPSKDRYQKVLGKKVFLREYSDYIDPTTLEKLCDELYYPNINYNSGETVVDFGAGLGLEAVGKFGSSDVRYIGVEILPSVYECLSETFSLVNPKWLACPFAIGDGDSVSIDRHSDYIKSSTKTNGKILIPSINWSSFIAKYEISNIDLLKINIEGAELDLFRKINNYNLIKKIVFSAHDFLAEKHNDESLRTFKMSKKVLESKGYKITQIKPSSRLDWERSWYLAERPTHTPTTTHLI